MRHHRRARRGGKPGSGLSRFSRQFVEGEVRNGKVFTAGEWLDWRAAEEARWFAADIGNPALPEVRPRLAVDVCLSQRAFVPLMEAGVEIIVEAGTAEPDEVWFAQAMRAGVHAVLSPDGDLRKLCTRNQIRWMRAPGHFPRWQGQVEFVLDELRSWGWL